MKGKKIFKKPGVKQVRKNAILDVGAVVDMSEKDATRLSGYGLVEVVDEPEPEPEQETPTEDQPEPKKATRTKKTE